MPDAPNYLDPRVLASLEGLELRARRIVEGYVSGLHRSPYHGFSIEFAEHREYAPGDDLRYLDWKVFARTDKFYLKQFEEETNMVSWLLLDTSESMKYQGPDAALSKLQYAQCAAAALAYLILRQRDSVGLVTFDREVRGFLRASGTQAQLKDLIQIMENSPAERKTALGPIFHDLAERFKKRGIVLVFSDLLDDVEAVLTGLAHFRHRRHDVILLHVVDPAELDFPFQQTTLFRGLEGLGSVLVQPRALRKAYLRRFDAFLRRLQSGCRMHQIDYVLLRTDQPLDLVLSSYLALRAKRLRKQ